MTKRTLNKYLLAKSISEEFNLTLEGSTRIISKILDLISEGLLRGERIVLVGFGSFLPVKRKARKILHPTSRQEINLPERVVPTFRPGSRLKKQMQKTYVHTNEQNRVDSQGSEDSIPSLDQNNNVENIDQYL